MHQILQQDPHYAIAIALCNRFAICVAISVLSSRGYRRKSRCCKVILQHDIAKRYSIAMRYCNTVIL